MNRLVALILGTGQPPALPPSDRDHGLGTCRWCLNIVTLRSSAWVHLATGHATCLDPPMGAPLTSAAQPRPPAPQTMGPAVPRRHQAGPDRLDARDHRQHRHDGARVHRGRANTLATMAKRGHTATHAMAFAPTTYPDHQRRRP